MNILSGLAKLAVNTVTLPVSAVVDVVTMSGGTNTENTMDSISNNLDEILD